MNRFGFRLLSLSLLIGTIALVGVTLPEPFAAEPKLSEKDMKPYVETISGTEAKFEMVPIPGGTYLMGSPSTEEGRNEDEGPQHEVTIRPFWMGKFEVTWEEFDAYAQAHNIRKEGEGPKAAEMSDVDGVTRPTPPYTDMTFGYGHDRYPAICMSHHAVLEYCRWISAKTKKTYRLPTEAEWEYACRAGTKTAYFFGNDAAKLGEYAWYVENSAEGTKNGQNQTHKVGLKKPNPWGLYDIHGNVSEWVIDHYDKGYYQKCIDQKLTLGPVLLPSERRFAHVVRGGSWDDDPPGCRSAARKASHREWLQQDPQRPQSIWWLTEGTFVGFRLVRPLEEQENLKGLKSKITKESKY